MADIEEALIHHLLNATAVKAIVGTRVFPRRIPSGESLPAITVSRVSTAFQHVHGEAAVSKTYRSQVTSWAEDLDHAKSLALLVRTALDGFSGTLGNGTHTLSVEVILIGGENEDDSEEKDMIWINQDYTILEAT